MNLFTDTIEESIDLLSDFQKNHPNGPYFICFEVFAIKLSFDETANKWLFATKKKANAFNSYWAERRSFGNLFTDEVNKICGLETLFESLRKTDDYYFLVPLRKKNRVILTKEQEESIEPTVFLGAVVHKTSEGTFEPIIFDKQEERERYTGPWKFLPHINLDEFDYENFPSTAIGISYFSLNSTCPEFEKPDDAQPYRLVRFLFSEYQIFRNIRNNVPDIYARYGQLWKERSPNINLFKKHYKEYIEPFDKAVDDIYEEYKTRYIKKEFLTTTPLRHAILRKIRDIYLKRQWETITKNNVYNIIFKNFSTKLYKI